ncbi:MAG TPA: amylo-alpha-1,6-glucosidase [Ktedonobacterales bacterium]|nr:amylo-alpha-1,6-glucosidase [Ktedonobacterales bacterium]
MGTIFQTPAPDHQMLAAWLRRGRTWLDELQTPIGLRASSAAGRYHALFGRDTLLTVMLALEAARLRPEDDDLNGWAAHLAVANLQRLSATQGTEERPENEEQPGKIVHEYWPTIPDRFQGDDAASRWPLYEGRYYGAVDSTYLYLMAIGMVWEQVAGGQEIVGSLWEHVRAALQWALERGDVDGDGLIEVQPRQPQGLGLRNQVWKDSGDALLLEDGSQPEPPVAWVEVQGYAVAAFRQMRAILQARGEDAALQARLAQRIARIQQRLGEFWLPEEGSLAMALTREKRPVPLVSSNMGHVLWCGALSDAALAESVAKRLLRADLLTTWGLRTLSSDSPAFDPYSYHRGSVWPFDNAITAAALWRMGRAEAARAIACRGIAAIERFGTPVELYCVIPAEQAHALDGSEALIEYPQACAVQAWSAAALLLFAAQLLARNEG